VEAFCDRVMRTERTNCTVLELVPEAPPQTRVPWALSAPDAFQRAADHCICADYVPGIPSTGSRRVDGVPAHDSDANFPFLPSPYELPVKRLNRGLRCRRRGLRTCGATRWTY